MKKRKRKEKKEEEEGVGEDEFLTRLLRGPSKSEKERGREK